MKLKKITLLKRKKFLEMNHAPVVQAKNTNIVMER